MLFTIPITFIMSVAFLFAISFISRTFWLYLFTVLVSWVIADLFAGFFVGGGRGAPRSPILRGGIQSMSIMYIMTFIGIVSATLFSSFFSDEITNYLTSGGYLGYLFASFFASVIVFFDMWLRLYTR